MFDEDWEKRREGDEFAPSLGKVPILWDGDCVVWDSLAIIEFLADRIGRDKYWPDDESARGMARSMAAEMHSGFANLRRDLPMNVRKSFAVQASVGGSPGRDRAHPPALGAGPRALRRHGGDFLFGNWCAVDIMYAPGRDPLRHLFVPVPPFAGVYMKAVLSHPACRRMDRQGPGRTLGDRAIRGRSRPKPRASRRSIGRAVLADVASVRREQHVDVRIAAASVRASADRDERAVLVALDCTR